MRGTVWSGEEGENQREGELPINDAVNAACHNQSRTVSTLHLARSASRGGNTTPSRCARSVLSCCRRGSGTGTCAR